MEHQLKLHIESVEDRVEELEREAEKLQAVQGDRADTQIVTQLQRDIEALKKRY